MTKKVVTPISSNMDYRALFIDFFHIVIFGMLFLGTIPILIYLIENTIKRIKERQLMLSIFLVASLIIIYLLPYIYLIYVRISKRVIFILSILAVIYIVKYLYRKLRKANTTIKFLPLNFRDPKEKYILAHWLHSAYKRAPWNEQKICPTCKDLNDFGPNHVYPYSLTNCPKCGEILINFWSVERTEIYLKNAFAQKNFYGIGAYSHDDLLGWIWGYEANPLNFNHKEDDRIFYIDVVGVIPAHRTNTTSRSLKRKILSIFYLFLKESMLFGIVINLINPPMITQLYHKLIKEIKKRGYGIIITRTHSESFKVHRLLALGRFTKMYADPTDKSREFWKKEL